jgi:hypothetical protein
VEAGTGGDEGGGPLPSTPDVKFHLVVVEDAGSSVEAGAGGDGGGGPLPNAPDVKFRGAHRAVFHSHTCVALVRA